jgi:hypothetical protein
MTKGMTLICWVFLGLLTTTVHGHEGHHDVPGNVSLGVPGAIARSTEDGYFGLVAQSDSKLKQDRLALYFFSLEDTKTPKAIDGIKLEVQLQLPGKKNQRLEFKPNGNHWVAEVSTKGIHRYTLSIRTIFQGATHGLKYTLEPKK